MSEQLKEALAELGERTPAVRVPDDLWRRGRRARLRERIAAMLSVVGVVVAITALVPVWLFGPAPLYAGGSPADAVPGKLHLPWMWQATVEQDPRGPASVLFTGAGLGLSGIDLIDHEGKVAVVGLDGSYRMLLYGGAEVIPGEDVLLSPDGTFVAQGFEAGAEKDGWVVITNLGTGKSRTFQGMNGVTCCGQPVAWAPDGKSLLAIDFNQEPTHFDPVTGIGVQPARLWLLDLTTGGTRQIVSDLGDLNKLRTASLAAFSPDGRRIAVTVGDELRMIDVTGRTLWTSTLEPGRYLAGTAAFTPDDTRIVTVAVEGCRTECDAPALAARQWHVGYLDARTGTNADGPPIAPVTGMAVRAVGWRHGTDLAALVYQPDRRLSKEMFAGTTGTGLTETGHVTLVALRQNYAPEVLLDPPNEVLALDVAQNLLRSGRFGGPAPEPAMFPARPLILLPIMLVAIPILGIATLAGWRLRLRRRPTRTGPVSRTAGGCAARDSNPEPAD